MRWVPPGGCGRRLAYVRACDNKGWSGLSDGGCGISRVLERASVVNELARSVATRETDLLRAASIVDVIRSDTGRLAERYEATGRTTD
jgi:hypothetical protein